VVLPESQDLAVEEIPKIPNTLQTEEKKDNVENQTTAETTTTITEPAHQEQQINDVRFRIQFFITKENFNTTDQKFAAIQEVKKYKENGIWKFTSGDYATLQEAQTKLKEVKKQFADAFIIVFNNDKKITLNEAQELLK
jgi:N-acetylmuramoyl-L-alanine amidase